MQRGFLRDRSSISATRDIAVDLTAVAVGCLCAYLLRFGQASLPPSYRTALILALLLVAIVFPYFNLYNSWRGRHLTEQFRRITLAWITVGLGLIFIAFMLKDTAEFSRLWFGYWGIFTGLLLVIGRLLVTLAMKELRRRGYNAQSIAIIGSGRTARDTVAHVQASAWSGLRIACVFDEAAHHCEPDAFGSNIETCSVAYAKLEHELVRRNIDEVWICLPFEQREQIETTLGALRQSTIRQRLIPDLAGMQFIRHPIADIIGVPMLNVSATPIHGVSRLIKDSEDKILALLFMLLASPVLAFIALAVKFDSSGPLIFKQRRHGADGQPIKVYKFRTMVVHEEIDGSVTQARKNDHRATSIGAFLRRTSLDELPQLLNVLQGRMSLVGPRPHALAHNEYYRNQIETYMQRHKIKPGITGWAQINGWRGETDTLEKMQKRVECDMYYIENWTPWLDIKIILLTLFRGFVSKRAY